ncbi:MAG: FHA domain-containing protein [Pseudomonadales bacterium]|nr:FHA domain-containing protein [Pseudomonadales bacterium]
MKYYLVLDSERFDLEGSTTVGRHLDNDLVVAGEDVLDFHLRVEPNERGAMAFPLGEASLSVNGTTCADPVALLVGDRLQVGQNDIEFTATPDSDRQADEWWLYADREESIYKVTGVLDVGRSEDNEVLLLDDHISRQHAQLRLVDGVVWLRDYGSANGTFVNGERLSGGCRLYHGDEISFDTLRFQLVGKGQDLTPVRRQQTATEIIRIATRNERRTDTTEIAAVDLAEPPLVVPDSRQTGAFLLGVSEPVSGFTFRTGIGASVIGRDEACDVVIRDSTVSARHAEIVVRPESTTVTNLMATNGTRVNGEIIQSAELADGDVLRIGRVSLVFKDVAAQESDRRWLRSAQWLLLGASLVMAVGLFLLWLL